MYPPVEHLHPYLPIHAFPSGERWLIYTPGLAIRASQRYVEALHMHFQKGSKVSGRVAETAEMLLQSALQTIAAREALATAAYHPTFLLLYISNICNCACAYCFTRQRPHHAAVREAAAQAAIDLVARNAMERGDPLHVHFHGGGETTLHLDLIERLATYARKQCHVPVEIALSTNGVLPTDDVQRIAQVAGLVRVSCDGPAELHDAFRRDLSGESTFTIVAETIDGLRELGVRLAIRATITRASVTRQRELVEFFVNRFGVYEMHFEPVYPLPGVDIEPYACDDSEEFAISFLDAHKRACELGASLHFSGIRLDEVHGPYCDLLYDALHVLPDGTATACFFRTEGAQEEHLTVGWYEEATGRFLLDLPHAARLRRRLAAIPTACRSCINACHCTCGCPGWCGSTDSAVNVDSFRCRLYRQLAPALIETTISISAELR